MKDILYITLKVQAAQNVSIQNDLKNKNKQKKSFLFYFFTINGLAKTGQTGPPCKIITPKPA